jgi:hypothetical protein
MKRLHGDGQSAGGDAPRRNQDRESQSLMSSRLPYFASWTEGELSKHLCVDLRAPGISYCVNTLTDQ